MRSVPEWLRPSMWGLAIRSALAAAAVVTIALAAGATALLFVLDRALISTLDDAASTRAQDITTSLQFDRPADLDSELFGTNQRITLVQVIDPTGQVVRTSDPYPGAPATDARPPAGGSPARGLSGRTDHGTDLRITAQGVSSGATDYTVIVAVSAEPVEATVATVGGLLALGGPVIALVAAVATYTLVRRSLRSVEHIRTQVAAISSSDLGERIPVPTPRDEISALARTMNDMLTRIDAGHTAQRRFVADASHELRNPLATLTLALELADARPELLDDELVRETLLPEVTRMHLLVDDLLLLARADEHGLPLRLGEVDLDDVVDAEVRRARGGTEKTITAALSPVRICGDRTQLERVVRNLIDNAVRFAAQTVHAQVMQRGDTAQIIVSDDGPGIPQPDRDRVLGRFVRLDNSRGRNLGGSGLGLAIVAEIVSAQGGSVRIGDSAQGGCQVVVTLATSPVTPAEQS